VPSQYKSGTEIGEFTEILVGKKIIDLISASFERSVLKCDGFKKIRLQRGNYKYRETF